MWLITLGFWLPLFLVLYFSLHWLSSFYVDVVTGHSGVLGVLYAVAGF